jgi:Na+/glutamate symporter
VIGTLGDALGVVFNVASALSPVFSAIGDAIAFVAENGRGAAIGIGLAATALGIYKAAAIASAIATAGLGTAVRALSRALAWGLLVTVFGAIAERCR